MLVGDLRIDPVADGMARIAPSAAYAGTGDEAWAPHRDASGGCSAARAGGAGGSSREPQAVWALGSVGFGGGVILTGVSKRS
jgi:hypothetical protein